MKKPLWPNCCIEGPGTWHDVSDDILVRHCLICGKETKRIHKSYNNVLSPLRDRPGGVMDAKKKNTTQTKGSKKFDSGKSIEEQDKWGN